MSIPGRKPRSNGRHTGGQPAPQTVPDLPEETVTAQSQPRPPAPAEALEDHLTLHEKALTRVREAKGGIEPLEEKIRAYYAAGDQLRGEAEDLRKRASEADLRADNQFAAATSLGEQRDALRTEAQTQQVRANYHGSRIDEEIALGAEDPKARRERIAAEEAQKDAAQRATTGPQPGFPTPSLLDGPNPPLGPGVTHPIPAQPQTVDDLQKTPAAGS